MKQKLFVSTAWTVLFFFALLICGSQVALAQASTQPGDDVAATAGGCAACGGCMIFFIIIIVLIAAGLALNIWLIIWVGRDAKSRGMDNSTTWILLVIFTGLIGLIIYLSSRPKGDLVKCSSCDNNRLQGSAKCPHCGNA